MAQTLNNAGRRRVVITGMGWITPLGDDIETVWQRLLNGDNGTSTTEIFDASTFPTKFAAQVKGFKLEKYLGADAERHSSASRNAKFALAAAKIAWESAGLNKCTTLDNAGAESVGKDSRTSDSNAGAGIPSRTLDPTRIGIYLGGGEGPIDFFNFAAAAVGGWDKAANNGKGDLNAVKWAEIAEKCLDATREFEQDPNMAAGHIACQFNVEGPSFNTLTACAASTQALGEATNLIRRGDADMVISGGAHSMIHPFGVTGFNRLTALSTRNNSCTTASRPFDRTRDGFVLGEGAGMLILEEYEHAKARGAKILCEIKGYGSTADAFRVTDIHEDGRGGIASMRLALKDAGLGIQDIHYISAHGTSTQENDKIESLAIGGVFGELAPKVPVSSVKSMLGHLIAAAGAVELITCVLAIRDGVLPPTMNYSEPDPNCPLDYVPNQARKAKVDAALSNSFGFGGQNDTLVITRVLG